MDPLCRKWLESYEKGSGVGHKPKGDPEKAAAIQRLYDAVHKEYLDEVYRATYSDRVSNELLVGAGESGRYRLAKANKKTLKRGGTVSTGDKKLIEQYESLKARGLTYSEISALFAYTGDQYIFMNPAMAGNKGWLKANMSKAEYNKQSDSKSVKKAIKTNQHIGGYVLSALQKLPPWPGGQTVYRGETVPEKEGKAMTGPPKPTVKTFPHFVSTSLQIKTPQDQIATWVTGDRPYKIIYHIVRASDKGRDILELSKYADREAEILFMPNTTFKVLGTRVDKPSEQYKEVDVEAT
jgi:hypothetical protein